jgi:hypothetical protein
MARRRRGGGGYAYPADVQRNPAAGKRPVDGQIVRGQSMDLGDLGGDAVEPVLATFTWFGERFRVNPDMTETTLIDLFEMARRVDVDPDLIDPNQLDFSKGYVREHIHPDDFDRLWKTARANRQGIQQLIQLCMRILGLVSERPTAPPSGSSDGRPVTSQNLPDGAWSRADDARAAEWWPEGLPYNSTAARVVERLEGEGRPDKANFVMLAQEARAASGARTG